MGCPVTTYVLVICLALLAGCATTQQRLLDQGGRRLDGPALRNLVTGSVLDMEGYGVTAQVTMHADGSLTATNSDGDRSPGFWRIVDDRLCIAFKRWGYGEERCFTVIGRDDRYYQFASPRRLAGSFRVAQAGVPAAASTVPSTTPPDEPIPAPPPQTGTPTVTVPGSSAPLALPAPLPRRTALDNTHLLTRMARNCPGCNLAGADLAHADLTGARLAGAKLNRANLRGAILRYADLAGADLSGADLTDADLRNADLRGADLSGADLTGARLDGARLDGVTK